MRPKPSAAVVCARSSGRLTPNPAAVPSGLASTQRSVSAARTASSTKASATPAHHTAVDEGTARCRWVYPGIGTGGSAARSRATPAMARQAARSSWSRSLSHRRLATSTWSLRLRPVWIRRPASPRRSVRTASIALWPSS
jgi:hypothetical protein